MLKAMMGFVVGAVVAMVGVSASAQEMPVHTCTVKAENKEMTVTLTRQEGNSGSYTMSIYRVISGHALTPEKATVTQLPASRGGISAYANAGQTKVLVLNFSERKAGSKTTPATLQDVNSGTTRLVCF